MPPPARFEPCPRACRHRTSPRWNRSRSSSPAPRELPRGRGWGTASRAVRDRIAAADRHAPGHEAARARDLEVAGEVDEALRAHALHRGGGLAGKDTGGDQGHLDLPGVRAYTEDRLRSGERERPRQIQPPRELRPEGGIECGGDRSSPRRMLACTSESTLGVPSPQAFGSVSSIVPLSMRRKGRAGISNPLSASAAPAGSSRVAPPAAGPAGLSVEVATAAGAGRLGCPPGSSGRHRGALSSGRGSRGPRSAGGNFRRGAQAGRAPRARPGRR